MSTEPLSIDSAAELLIAPPEAQTVDSEEAAVETLMAADESDIEESIEDEAEAAIDDTDDTEMEGSDDDEEADELETDDEVEQDEQPQSYTVKVDGREETVTLEELKRGYSGQKKIQLGMQEAAAARKAAQEAAERSSMYEQQLAALLNNVQEQGVIAPPTPPSSELARTDPFEFNAQMATFHEQAQAYQAQQAQIQQAAQLNKQKQTVEQQQLIAREAELAREKIPELADANRAPAYQKQLVDFGQNVLGFGIDELGNIADHRALYAMHLARVGYEAMAGKSKAEVKSKTARPVVKAGAKKVSDSQRQLDRKARAQLKTSGKAEDAVSLLMNQ